MSLIDWIIVAVPLFYVLYVGVKCKKYINGVSDFLTAGRVAGRYVICVAGAEAGMGLISIVALFEGYYKSGFAYSFWSSLSAPVGIVMALTGFCIYRYRESRAMTMGQFLEIRYSRNFRLFAGILQSISGIINYALFPAVGAKFFIYFCDLPINIEICGWVFPTFALLMALFLGTAVVLASLGGQIAIIVTDCLQGIMSYPMYAIIAGFIIYKYSWFDDMAPAILNRPKGQSMVNPFDITELRDFNLFYVLVGIFGSVLNRMSWSGTQGFNASARDAHEQKMGAILGAWRSGFSTMMIILLALVGYMYLNSDKFETQHGKATACRTELGIKAVNDIINGDNKAYIRKDLISYLNTGEKTPEFESWVAKGKAMEAQAAAAREKIKYRGNENVKEDKAAEDVETKNKREERMHTVKDALKGVAPGSAQTFSTIFGQMRVPMALRYIMPVGIIGVFCAICIFLMLSTDVSYLHSWGSILVQDVILPIRGKPFTPKQQLFLLRLLITSVAVFAFFFSYFFGQVDYILMFFAITGAIWMGGAGACITGGLYWKRGTTAGAWAALIAGSTLAVSAIFVQSFWVDKVYPWLYDQNMVGTIAVWLETVSAPFEPIIMWRMSSDKFPINSQEVFAISMLVSVSLYIIVSLLTCKEPFNMDRMLHRGKYKREGEALKRSHTNLKEKLLGFFIGIDSQYTRGDKILAWSVFCYSFVWSFGFCFATIAIWNIISPWSNQGWSRWFFIQNFIIAGVIAVISTVWLTWGGTRDLYRLFRALDAKQTNVLDDGRVIDNVSADDIEMVEKLDNVKIEEAHIEEEILREELIDEGDTKDLKNLDDHTKE